MARVRCSHMDTRAGVALLSHSPAISEGDVHTQGGPRPPATVKAPPSISRACLRRALLTG